MRVSFDFDSTLNTTHGTAYANELMRRGIEVWIVTSRFLHHYEEVVTLAKELGIPAYNIVFTAMNDKAKYFSVNDNFIWHLDDDWIELELIAESNLTIKGVAFFGNPDWKKECEQHFTLHK